MTIPLGQTSEPVARKVRPELRGVSKGAIRLIRSTEAQILVAAVTLFIVFSVLYPDSFFTTGTFMNMARVAGILLVVSLGQSFALIVGGFDISVGATMGFVSIIISLFMVDGGDVTSGILIGLLAGLVVGLFNGLIIAAFGVTPFVTTLGMLTFLRGLADQLGNGGSIVGLPRSLSSFGRGNWFGIPSAACLAVIALVIAWLFLQRTRAGLYIFSIGGNRETARVAGVHVVRYEVIAYTLCGLFAGVAGVMLTSRVAIGQGSLGTGYELLSIATAVIGGVAIGGGIGRLSGVVLGVLLLTFLTTGLDIAGVNSFYQQMVTGAVLVGAVLISQLQRRSR
jgi:ribose/xylose/arabinose/galactoside ABC-type transport system permease subunit